MKIKARRRIPASAPLAFPIHAAIPYICVMREQLAYLILMLKRLGIALLLFTLCRILFLTFNLNYFPTPGLEIFLVGLRFDLTGITLIFLPYIFFQMFPIPWKGSRTHEIFMKWLFHSINGLALLVAILDFEYFKFTLKRSSWDLFSLIGLSGDVPSLLPQFLKDYWYLFLIWGLLFYGSLIMYRLIAVPDRKQIPFKWYWDVPMFLAVVVLWIIGGRGGVQLRPLDIIDASRYTTARNVPLMLNTPFTIIKTMDKNTLEPRDYFDEAELDHIYQPINTIQGESDTPPMNVVILILESFSKEYIGAYNNGNGYTPQLDDLMSRSIVFTHAFANGKKSIEALPAIFSGIPSLMTDPYILSPYSGNEVKSIASELKPYGYTSSFFHGGKNGTMGFNSFTGSAGFDHYYGKDEYPDETDFDGNWGIFDEPYLQYVVKELDRMPEPFLTSIFTLSSHHPYKIPEEHKGRFPKGELPIHETIGYTDHALGRFFEAASQTEWFDHTIFLITADHTAQSHGAKYATSAGIYAVPLIIFDPRNAVGTTIDEVTQHCDILPTLIDYLGFPAQILAYGGSNFDHDRMGFTVNYLNGLYQYITPDRLMKFDGNKVIGYYDYHVDSLLKNNLVKEEPELVERDERRIKAIIQSYNHRMINNQLTIPAQQ